MIAAGTSLLHYRVVEKIGEGGMGAVWRATDSTLDRDIAIKVLPADFASDAERLARFEREAKVLASLNHPHIGAIYGFHEVGGVRFLAMELVPGEDLSQRLEKGSVPFSEAADMARQIAAGLEYAHERGIVHRDLKPANIKITPEGSVKVLDFGLAKAVVGDSTASGPDLGADDSPHDDERGNRDRHDPRHSRVHEPRAGARQACRQARGHLGLRRRALRDARRPAIV